MAKNLLVINCDIRETRVALIENGIIAELHLERDSQVGTLGNIYLGKVSRVLPGMQAAFIDVGLERAAFLHVEDLIRPDDFEAYLAGHRTAMGGTNEAKVDDGSDAPNEEDADATAAAAAPAAVGSTPGAAAAVAPTAGPARTSGGTATPGGAAAPEEGGERRGRRRRRGRGRRGAEGAPGGDATGPGAEASTFEAGTFDAGSSDEGTFDAGSSDEGAADEGDDEPAVELELASAVDREPISALEELASELGIEQEAAAAEPVVSNPSAEETAWADPTPDAASGPPSEAPAQSGPAEREPAAQGEPAEGEASASPEDAPSPSRRRGRGRRTKSSRSTGVGGEAAAADGGSEIDVTLDLPVASFEVLDVPPAEAAGQPAGEQVEDQGVLEPPVAGAVEDDAGTRAMKSRRGKARSRRSGRTTDRREKMAAVQAAPPAPAATSRKPKGEPLRVSKSTPIREVVREGQEVIVQVSKEPIGTKGARVTSHVSLPGRYVVYLPTVEHVGISKRIGSEKERGRLRSAIDAMKPPTGGLIVRTLAEGLTKKDLKNDVGYLVRLWGEVIKKRETTRRAPECLYTELDIVLRAARDLFTDDIEKIVIDDAEQYARLKHFIEMFMPERADAIELYQGAEPIFDAYGIEEEIGRALSRKVPLDSGGYLIIDQAEALTAIDVNTGKFVGKGSTDLEDTILKTNLEAVQEIAYQLRFRNLGGLIVLDLIDMEKAQNREKVRRRLEDLLAKDKAKTTLNRISDLGLIEMTRKRTRESLSRTMNEPCFYCDGTGNLQSKQTVAYEILRQIKRELANLRGYLVVVSAHPAVVDLLKHEERAAVIEAERRYQRRIDLVPRKEYHLEQFDLVGR